MKALYTLREIAFGIALIILIPSFAYWSAQMLAPEPAVRGYEATRELQDKISRLWNEQRKLEEIQKKLATKNDPASIKRTKELDAELEKIYNEVKITEEQRSKIEKEQDELYKKASIERSRIFFYTAAVIGVICIVVGSLISVASISVGSILSGIITLTMGYWSYWNHINNMIKFISITVALLIVLFSAYHLSRKEK